jgi:hypothetical protein
MDRLSDSSDGSTKSSSFCAAARTNCSSVGSSLGLSSSSGHPEYLLHIFKFVIVHLAIIYLIIFFLLFIIFLTPSISSGSSSNPSNSFSWPSSKASIRWSKCSRYFLVVHSFTTLIEGARALFFIPETACRSLEGMDR